MRSNKYLGTLLDSFLHYSALLITKFRMMFPTSIALSHSLEYYNQDSNSLLSELDSLTTSVGNRDDTD